MADRCRSIDGAHACGLNATSIVEKGDPRQLAWNRLFVAAQLQMVRAQVCRDQRDQEKVLTTGEGWKKTVVKNGWR